MARSWSSAGCSPTSRATCPTKPVDVATEGNKVSVVCGSSRFSLMQMPADDYPTLPTSPTASGTIAGDVFTQAVAQVSIAADRGDTLPILTGVRVEIEGDKMTLLATDRYRLAMRELTWNPEATDASHLALVPARTLSETAKALGASGSIEVALGSSAGGDGLVGFEAGQRRTTTRLLDGEYPKVTSIFPTSVDTEAVIKTSDLIEAVKRVALVAERNTPVRLKFSDGQVAIEAGTGDDAQASEAVESTLTGPEIEIAFNPQFLLDGLGAVGTDYSRFSFTQPSRPAVLSGQDEAGRRGRHHLPLRADARSLRELTTPGRSLSGPHPKVCRAAGSAAYRTTHTLHPFERASSHAARSDRSRQDGRQHARADPPRRPRGGGLRPRPEGVGRQDPGRVWSRRSTPPAPCG